MDLIEDNNIHCFFNHESSKRNNFSEMGESHEHGIRCAKHFRLTITRFNVAEIGPYLELIIIFLIIALP
jgi:hypothetical protein